MQIKLAQSDFDTMVDWAKEHLPEESCGLLGGTKDGDVRTVKKVYYLTNIDHTNEHFSMDPKEQLKAIKDMRANGLTPLGNWHSHPETPARPSQEDVSQECPAPPSPPPISPEPRRSCCTGVSLTEVIRTSTLRY